MRLWTSQDVGFYEDLMSNGIAYCNKVSDFAKDNGIAYQWMVEQMKRRIGEPPLPEITLPVWAWYQYESKQKNKPPLSDNSKTHPGQKEMMIEFETPAEDVLLSGFVLWHHPLNGWDLSIDKRIAKRIDEFFHIDFNDKPEEIQKLIVDSWDVIFDLDFRHSMVTRHKKNRSIQATLWCIKKEWVVSAVEY